MTQKINFEIECNMCFAEANHLPAMYAHPSTMCETHRADWV